MKGWPPSHEEALGPFDSCVPTQRVKHAERSSAFPPRKSHFYDVVQGPPHTRIVSSFPLPTQRALKSSRRAALFRPPRRERMEYEEELDDNGVLRVRRVPSPRVPSPFVPIQDEKEAPPMAFDADQMKAFRKVTP